MEENSRGLFTFTYVSPAQMFRRYQQTEPSPLFWKQNKMHKIITNHLQRSRAISFFIQSISGRSWRMCQWRMKQQRRRWRKPPYDIQCNEKTNCKWDVVMVWQCTNVQIDTLWRNQRIYRIWSFILNRQQSGISIVKIREAVKEELVVFRNIS